VRADADRPGSRPTLPCALALSGAGAALLMMAAVVLFAITLARPAAASAGTYTIENCPLAPGGNGDAGPWEIFGGEQGSEGTCGAGSGWIGPRGASMSPGSGDGVQVAVPAGSDVRIRGAKIWWYVPHQISGADTFALAAASGGLVGESTTPLDQRGDPSVFTLGSTTTALTLEDYCSNDDAGQGCTFGAGENPNLELLGSELTLEDSRPPSGSASGGALASAGPVSGVQSLGYRAEDADSGVRLVRLLVDGRPVAERDYLAGCAYANFLACPQSESDSLAWDTASAPDGQHDVQLILQNAAQDTSVVYDATITTHNTLTGVLQPSTPGASLPGPLSGLSGVSIPGTANGAGASETARVRLVGGGSLKRGYQQSAVVVRGSLLDGGGHPISGAHLDVLQQRDGEPSRVLGQVLSAADGSFTARIAAGSSRLIQLAYRAFSGDRNYAAVASLRETVAGALGLNVTPRRTSSTGRIVLSGRVLGSVPRAGVVVELLVRYRGAWEPFRTPRTDGFGRFHLAYRFQGAVGRFPFRAAVLGGQSGFPYAGAKSNTVDVSAR
jgi:hypothetical protein